MKIPGLLINILFIAGIPLFARSQDASPASDSAPTIFQYLQRAEVSEITLTANFTELYEKRKEEFQIDAAIAWETGQGEKKTMDIQLELRGRYRRRVCDYPPIRLNFFKGDLEKSGFSRRGDKLKLVGPCNEEEENDQYVLKEYWTYRLYNQMTPASFRVQLLKIRYIDAADVGRDTTIQMGFMLESEEELAARLGGEVKELWGTAPDQVDRESYHYTVLLQHMIGNDDWDIAMNRNIAFIQTRGRKKPLVIPYDFDFSGLVNAPYAKANRNPGALTVTDRLPIGKFDSKESLDRICEQMLAIRKEVIKSLRECAYLSSASKREMTEYLNGFFTLLRDDTEMRRLFLAE